MTAIRIAVQIQPQHADYPAIREAAARCEDMGVDVIYNWDHFFPLFGGSPDPNVGKHFECWTMLAAWAEQTSTITIGPLVTCNSYRNPDLLADMARTVDHIAEGRVVFGIGAGWFEKDYTQYGYEFGTAPQRLRALAEAMPRIEARFSELDPPPVGPMPILIGGGGEKVTLKIVARHADIWHGFGDVATIRHKSEVLARHCADIGRDPAEIERSVGFQLHSAPLDQADAYVEAGVTEFTLGVSGPDYDLTAVDAWLAWRDATNS